ncbi:MAG: TetR family transcriptional regulator [Clostridiales bacterium]|nr:TetR family transcriptional regulator [Clostridiales bacterium]
MSESLITKKALGTALKQLMSEHPFEKISVKDICDSCGLNRNSFYYHFKDKQDLIIWIFDYEFIQKIQTREFSDLFEFYETICEYFYENKIFYAKAFEITGQNCFSDYFSEVFHHLSIENMEKYFGETDSKEKEYYARFATDALRMSLIRWLNDKTDVPPHEVTSMAKNAIIAISERCCTLYPEEIEKHRKKMSG